MSKVEVSVIILNYNTFQFTCRCIESVIEKTTDVDYEIILVDNGSTECNPTIFKNKFPNIKLIVSELNLGFSKGCNLGISHSSGAYILLLNSDTALVNNAIQMAYDYFRTAPTVGIVTVQLHYPDGQIQHNCQRFFSIRLFLLEKLRLHKLLSNTRRARLFLGAYFDHQSNAICDWTWGTFMMIPTEIISKMPDGKLNDYYFMYVEDMQWCYDIKKIGYEVAFLSDAKVVHDMGKSAGKKNSNIQTNSRHFVTTNYSSIKALLLKWLYHL